MIHPHIFFDRIIPLEISGNQAFMRSMMNGSAHGLTYKRLSPLLDCSGNAPPRRCGQDGSLNSTVECLSALFVGLANFVTDTLIVLNFKHNYKHNNTTM